MGSVTQGIISGLNRQIQVGTGQPLRFKRMLQLTLEAAEGTGKCKGEVIGVNT